MVHRMHNKNSIGIVSKVFTNKIVIEIPDTNKLNNNFLGDLYICDGINSLVTIHKSNHQKFIYQILSLYELEKPYDKDEELSKFSEKAYFEAIPLGEILEEGFHFGLSRFPMIGSDVYLTINQDVDTIFALTNQELSLTLGCLSSHIQYSPRISVVKLLTHHLSILGNTGSGKSTTVRKLLHEINDSTAKENLDIDSANFVIFDVHDEYSSLPEQHVHSINVSDELAIPLETLSLDDWINLVQPSTAVQLPILMNGLRLANIIETDTELCDWVKVYCALELYNNVQTEAVAKRAKIVGLLSSVNDAEIDAILVRYNPQYGSIPQESEFKEILKQYIKRKSNFDYEECKDQIQNLMESSHCSIKKLKNIEIGLDLTFLFEEAKGNAQVRSYCSTLITRINNLIAIYSKTLFDENERKISKFHEVIRFEKGFTILNVSSMDDSDLLFFTGYLLRIVYNSQKEVRGKHSSIDKLFHFIFDEAHKYITEDNERTAQSIRIFEQIAKEGRKFGIFMILASQRPGELSKTVLSQCNNYILHRIRNNIDLEQMRKSIPYLSDSQLTRISYLRTGSALLVGEAFSIPMEIIIKGEEYGDISKTISPLDVWKPISVEQKTDEDELGQI
jgi:hypothetical protein